MNKKLQAKLMVYNAIREQIYASLAFNEHDLTNDFTFSHALARSVRRLRAAIERMEKMSMATNHIPTPAELAEAIRLSKLGMLET